MSLPAPADLLRHRPPAVLVEAIVERGAGTLACSAASRDWTWPRMLEAAAQTAGLLAGMQPDGPRSAVVAQYRDVVLHAAEHRGALRVRATLERRVLQFWRCRFAVRDVAGRLLLEGSVALAPDASEHGPGGAGVTAPTRIAPPPADPRMFALLASEGFGEELFNERQHQSCEYVDLYVVQLAIRIVEELGVAPQLAEPRSVAELVAAYGFADEFRKPLAWLLAFLARVGVVDAVASPEPCYRLVAPLPEADPESVRAAALAIDPSYAPTYAMLDQAAVAYGKVARGEATGEHALFQNVALWTGYFSNANGYYAINNRVAAAAAAARIADGARVIEVGAGLGSATEALLERLGERARGLASYRVTEPVPFFRRRAERSLRARFPGVPLELSALDVNLTWREQGIAEHAYELVWGVNVFHLGRRLAAVLREAHEALVPGGALVVGEGMRPQPRGPVAAELPFQLLASFVDVETGPERPQPGFLTAAQWRVALERAGFADVVVVPDVERLVEMKPGFYGAAACGRRRR